MNTDNMTISGETIDYGPCAFMDAFDPATVFSSIDERGRYAYGNQPGVLQWNLARLAEALLPLFDDTVDDNAAAAEAATEVLNGFAQAYEQHWTEGMAAKLGLGTPDRELTGRHPEADAVAEGRLHRSSSARCRPAPRGRCSPSRSLSTRWAARREALLPADRAAVGRRDGPGQPRLHPAQSPRRGGAGHGDQG